MKIKYLFTIILIAILFTACDPEDSSNQVTIDPDEITLAEYIVDYCDNLNWNTQVGVSYCEGNGCYPGRGESISELQPTFDWDGTFSYINEDGIGEEECIPYAYRFILTKVEPFYSDDDPHYFGMGNPEPIVDAVIVGEEGEKPDTHFALDFELEPVSIYTWRIIGYKSERDSFDGKFFRFVTGPYCESSEELGHVVLEYPENNKILNTTNQTPSFLFIFKPVELNCMASEFEIQFSGQEDFQSNKIITSNATSVYFAEQDYWKDFPDCQDYYWRARPIAEDGSSGQWSSPNHFQININDACSNGQSSELMACTLTTLVNLNCRPGIDWEPVELLLQGYSAEVIGDSEYFWKINGNEKDSECIVPKDGGYAEVEGDCEKIEPFTPLPAPTPTPIPESACLVEDMSTGEFICTSPCPAGAVPGDPCTP